MISLLIISIGCRTQNNIIDKISIEPSDTYSATDSANGNEVCNYSLSQSERWTVSFTPYALWPGTFSIDPNGEKIAISDGYYTPGIFTFDIQNGELLSYNEGDYHLLRSPEWTYDILNWSTLVNYNESGEPTSTVSLPVLWGQSTDEWTYSGVASSSDGELLAVLGQGTNGCELNVISPQTLSHVSQHIFQDSCQPYDWFRTPLLINANVVYTILSPSSTQPTLHRIDINTGVHTQTPTSGSVISLNWGHDDSIVTVDTDGLMQKWDQDSLYNIGDGPLVPPSLLNTNSFAQALYSAPIALSPDERFWAGPGEGGTVSIHRTCDDEEVLRLQPSLHPGGVLSVLPYNLTFGLKGTSIIVVFDGEMVIWELTLITDQY